MARFGLNIKVDVNKIKKSRLFKGEKGTYLDLTTFINTEEEDQYGNHGFISQATSKEERGQGVKTPILGNVKVFFSDSSERQEERPPNFPSDDVDEDEIPF